MGQRAIADRLRPVARNVLERARAIARRAVQPLRRRMIARRLRRRPLPRRVLFVCYGNICRSPYAARAFATRVPARARDRMEVSSAGFFGPGRPAPSDAVASAAVRGVDLRSHRAQLVTREIVAAADLVVVMDPRQERAIRTFYGRIARNVVVLGDLDPEANGTRAIHDPIEQPQAVFDAVYQRIDRCLEALTALTIGHPETGLNAPRER